CNRHQVAWRFGCNEGEHRPTMIRLRELMGESPATISRPVASPPIPPTAPHKYRDGCQETRAAALARCLALPVSSGRQDKKLVGYFQSDTGHDQSACASVEVR